MPPRGLVTSFPIDYIDTTLVINTWETITGFSSGGKRCKILYMYIEQTNNGATDEDLELELTYLDQNGTTRTITFSLTAASGQRYYCYLTGDLTGGIFTGATSTSVYPMVTRGTDNIEGWKLRALTSARVRQTTDVDVVAAQIELNAIWETEVNLN